MDHNSPSLPDIPIATGTNVRPMPLSVATRVEVISHVIADVLHSAYQMQACLPPTHFKSLPGAVQRVYEGMARLAVVPLLDHDRLVLAEQRAVQSAAAALLNYRREDDDAAEDGLQQPTPEMWEQRVTNMVRSAISVYHTELSR